MTTNSTFSIIHIPAHSNSPGQLASTNAQDGALTASSPLLPSVQATQNLKNFFIKMKSHHKYNSLYLTNRHSISFMPVAFSSFTPLPSAGGISPQELKFNAIWQTDISEF